MRLMPAIARWSSKAFISFLFLVMAHQVDPARAEVVCSDDSEIAVSLNRPIHTWQDSSARPKAVVLALHGATLHGTSFDRLGRQLAREGFLVVAPDLRGFGRWCHDDSFPLSDRTIRFNKTEVDLVETLDWLHARYPDLRLFCLGESLGSNWALLIAANYPDKTDGLILSSPSVKRRSIISPRGLRDLFVGLVRVNRPLDISVYIRRCISEDGRIVEERLSDPLGRNRMSALELIKISLFMAAAPGYASRVSAQSPILIIQGTADRIVNPDSVRVLSKVLKSEDLSICWRPSRGHIALQTDYIQPDVLSRVSLWLEEHVSGIKRAQL